jgi:hypothetical protein
MVGFAMFHGATPATICLLGIPFLLASGIWFIVVLAVGIWRRFTFATEEFALIGLVGLNFLLVFLPYSAWEHMAVSVCGPGSGGEEYLREFAYAGDLPAIQTLIRKGYSFNPPGPVGTEALMAAVSGNRMNVVEFLLTAGASVNGTTRFGETPLMASASSGTLSMTKFLLSQGAAPCPRDKDGHNAFELAEKYKRHDAAALLAGFHCPARPPDPDIATCNQRSDCVVVH